MGYLLDATPAGMAALASQCSSWAGGIAAAAAPSVLAGAEDHASAAVVAAIHARTGLDTTALATRMTATGGALATTAAGFTTQDAQSATQLANVAAAVV